MGPPELVMAVMADQVPMARPRSERGKPALTSDRLFGTSRAAPIPCTARAAISCVASAAKPAATEAMVRMASPAANRRRRPKRSPADPDTRVRAPRKSV